MRGKHIELFLVDGTVSGLTTLEIAGWTGHVLAAQRTDLARILQREEARRNGTYILLGSDPESPDGVRAYIGKTERFTHRFRDHDAKKDFWDRMVIVTAKDDAFNEGHWGYLESRLVEEATKAGRYRLENTQIPQPRKLSEAQRSDMEAFLSQLSVILPVISVDILRGGKRRTQAISENPATASPVFSLTMPKRGVDARAQVIDGEFTLLEGSVFLNRMASKQPTESSKRFYESIQARRDSFIAAGAIRLDNGRATTTKDIPFSSPSLAGSFVVGRACNGRREWKTADQTYGQWEERGLNELDTTHD